MLLSLIIEINSMCMTIVSLRSRSLYSKLRVTSKNAVQRHSQTNHVCCLSSTTCSSVMPIEYIFSPELKEVIQDMFNVRLGNRFVETETERMEYNRIEEWGGNEKVWEGNEGCSNEKEEEKRGDIGEEWGNDVHLRGEVIHDSLCRHVTSFFLASTRRYHIALKARTKMPWWT